LNVFNLRSVYPNVVVCARPFLGGGSSCASVCMSFEGDTKLGGKLKSTECKRPLHVVLPATDRRMQVVVTRHFPVEVHTDWPRCALLHHHDIGAKPARRKKG
jgi:hypothetical protein